MRNDLPNEKAPNFDARLRETMMTYLGKQGDPLDRGVTLRDLVDSGIVELPGGKVGSGSVPMLPGGAIVNGSTERDLTPPPAPTGFAVSSGVTTVFIEHDKPTYTQGHGHLRTHVYGVTVKAGDSLPSFADAVELTQFSGQVFAYSTNPSTTWRMWITWETVDGVIGQPSGGTNGLEITTGQDVALLLEALTGQITESELYADLGARIDLIDVGPDALVPQVTAVKGSYTVKVDNNGYVTGFGLASTSNNGTPTSSFGVRADSFYIASPSGPGVSPAMPFIVRTTATTIGGVSVPVGVYITDAFIQNGTISNAKIANAAIDDAKIANLSASKITAGTIAADRLDANTITSKVLTVDWAKITNAYVTSAQIADTIQSNNWSSGAGTGWQINKAGTATFNEVTLRGKLTSISAGGNVELGANVGPSLGHYGLSLSNTNFNNVFIRRSDGTAFFRVNEGGTNFITFDSASGNLNIKSAGFSVQNGVISFTGTVIDNSNIYNESVNIFQLARGASLPDYVRTYKGNVTPYVVVNDWMVLQLDGSSLNNKISAVDYDSYRTYLPAGTYFYELSVPVKCDGSDTNDAAYTAIVINPPGTWPGGYNEAGDYIASGYSVISSAGVNVLGDWQTGTIFGVGRFTLSSPGFVSAAVKTTDGSPGLRVVARSGFSTTILRIWRDGNA